MLEGKKTNCLVLDQNEGQAESILVQYKLPKGKYHVVISFPVRGKPGWFSAVDEITVYNNSCSDLGKQIFIP